MKIKRYYFDYAAATPVDPAVRKAMEPYFSEWFGNPGSLHRFGQEASAAVFKSRRTIAATLGCSYQEIVFTGSATEANNLALRGAVKSFQTKAAENFLPKIIISGIEHESVLDTARRMEMAGEAEVAILPVLRSGIVDLKKLPALLDERIILVSVMYANNEIGMIQPIAEIAKIIKEFKNKKSTNQSTKKLSSYPLFHTDAVQAFNYLDCDVQKLGVDLVTLSAQKIYGPKGVGLLYIKTRTADVQRLFGKTAVSPIITGGGQEFGLRSGTENVPVIMGFAKAAELASNSREWWNKEHKKFQDYFWKNLKKKIPKAELNGDMKNRLPNNLNVYIPGRKAQEMLVRLDLAGFAVSAGSACTARAAQPSQVLKAMGRSDERAKNSLRITFGRLTKKSDLDKLLKSMLLFI